MSLPTTYTDTGSSYLQYAKAQAKAEAELEVERWVHISIECGQGSQRTVLHTYELPVAMLERWSWVINWRRARCICERPRTPIQTCYHYEYRYKGVRMGWQQDINTLVAAKAKYTKRLRAVEAYIASQQGNMFFDPASDETLLKAQAKLKLAEQDIEAAHERMRAKFNDIIINSPARLLQQ